MEKEVQAEKQPRKTWLEKTNARIAALELRIEQDLATIANLQQQKTTRAALLRAAADKLVED